MLHHLEDGCLEGADHERLMQIFRTDAEARKEYLNYMGFISLLYGEAEAEAELDGKSRAPFQEQKRSSLLIRSVIGAAAVLAMGAWIASLFFLKYETTQAQITEGPSAIWEFISGGINETTGAFRPESEVSLKTGTLNVMLSSGSEVIVEGPAEFAVHSPSEISLSEGRLWAKADSEKFIVNTRELKVTDLGTEFGITTSRHLKDEIHVASGKVLISRLNDEKNASSIELTTGQASRLTYSGKFRRIAFDQTKFQRELPQQPPYLHWSFDRKKEDGFQATGFAMPESSIEVFQLPDRKRPIPTQTQEGRFGQALSLETGKQYAQSNFPGIDGNLPRTIAFWIRNKSEDPNTYVLVSWGLATDGGTKWVLGLKDDDISTGWGGSWAGANITKKTDHVFDGKWHHIAQVFTGRVIDGQPEIIHYLDGNQLKTRKIWNPGPINTDCMSNKSWPVTLGVQLYQRPNLPTFSGLIDELYLFRSALDASQIRYLMKNNRLPFQ